MLLNGSLRLVEQPSNTIFSLIGVILIGGFFSGSVHLNFTKLQNIFKLFQSCSE